MSIYDMLLPVSSERISATRLCESAWGPVILYMMKCTNPTCIIPVEIDVFDYEIRLLANIGNQLYDLFDISSLADQKRAAKIVDKLEMINVSGHYGQMNIKVASKVLDKFLHDNLLMRLDEKTEKLKVRDSRKIFRRT